MKGIGSAISWAWEHVGYPLIAGIFKGVFGVDLPDWPDVAKTITDSWNTFVSTAGVFLRLVFGTSDEKPTEEELSKAKKRTFRIGGTGSWRRSATSAVSTSMASGGKPTSWREIFRHGGTALHGKSIWCLASRWKSTVRTRARVPAAQPWAASEGSSKRRPTSGAILSAKKRKTPC